MVIVLMGPAGAGKTTVGTALARAPWLASVRDEIERAIDTGESLVLVCSALKRSYREALCPRSEHAARQVRFVYLKATPERLDARLRSRVGHFAPPRLLASQLEALEEPLPGEGVLTVDGERPVAELVAQIRRALDE